MGRGLVSLSGLVNTAASKACRGIVNTKKPVSAQLPKQVYKGFQEIKKALALFRAHLWFDYLQSPLPKVDILITFTGKEAKSAPVSS